MDRLTQRFLSACALGAGLTVFLWFLFGAGPGALAVAAVLGGFAGYVLVDAKAFAAAVPEAWRFAKRGTRAAGTETVAFFRAPRLALYGVMLVCGYAFVRGWSHTEDQRFALIAMTFFGLLVMMGVWVTLSAWLIDVDHSVAPDRSLVARWGRVCHGAEGVYYDSPLTSARARSLSDGLLFGDHLTWSQSLRIHAELLFFVPLVRLPVWVVRLVIGFCVGAFSLAYLLVTELFRLVHNDLRTACLVDSVLGGTLVALQAMLLGDPDRLSVGVKLMCVAAGALFGLGFGGISHYAFTGLKRRTAS